MRIGPLWVCRSQRHCLGNFEVEGHVIHVQVYIFLVSFRWVSQYFIFSYSMMWRGRSINHFKKFGKRGLLQQKNNRTPKTEKKTTFSAHGPYQGSGAIMKVTISPLLLQKKKLDHTQTRFISVTNCRRVARLDSSMCKPFRSFLSYLTPLGRL